ncbi:MAG TPA: lipoyl domain-containing protein [Rhodocyclaceae bacterium]|nr:lipoyl domain-containing protein [Rhodocyclaceae bacterium]
MGSVVEVRIPKYPDCWESCGNCANGEVYVQSVLVSPGQPISRDATLIVLETGKVALDIPSPYDGVIIEVRVTENEPAGEGEVIALIDLA